MNKTCKWCTLEIGKSTSCAWTPVIGFNQRWERIPFGEEVDFNPEMKTCPGCEILVKGHHHVYCPVEECPNCKGKMNECGCFYKMKEE